MNYLYHGIRGPIIGSKLVPLTALKKIAPKKYKEEMKKYRGREWILKNTVNPLHCRAEETINLTAVHPRKIKHAFRLAGNRYGKKDKWLKINPFLLDPTRTTIYLYKYTDAVKERGDDNYAPFDPRGLSKYSNIPAKTIKYYKTKDNPFVFHFVPHILYRGKINIKDHEVIEA